MVRMTDLLKKAKNGLKSVAKKEVSPPVPEKEEKLPSPAKESPKEPPRVRRTPEPEKPPAVLEKQTAVPEKPPAPIPAKELPMEPPEKEKEPEPVKAPRVPEKVPEKEKAPSEKGIEFSDLLLGGIKEPHKEDIANKVIKASIIDERSAKDLYLEALAFMRNIFNRYKNDGAPINKDDILNMAQRIVHQCLLSSGDLLKVFHEMDSLEEHRMYNAINVSILSSAMGVGFKYNKSTLVDLAIVGLLHDLDLMKNEDIYKSEKLDAAQKERMRKHTLNIATYLDNAFKFSDKIVKSILYHHERIKGQGYPSGLLDGDIHEMAMIVGIADTYEAMTHSRPYKTKMSAHEAVLDIIKNARDLFPDLIVKTLVSCIGIYPMGTWIELNTGEMCKVLMVNFDAPLRPIISIVMDKDRKKFREIRTVDLTKIPSLYIKQYVGEIGEEVK